jgi:hypothetical protein
MTQTFTGKVIFAGLLTLTFQSVGFAQTSSSKDGKEYAERQIPGAWRGKSVCMVANSPCHDETNVYRISSIAGKSASFSIIGSKVVDG